MGSIRGTLVGFLIGTMLSANMLSGALAFRIVSFDGKFTRWNGNAVHYVLDSRGSKDFSEGCDSAGPCVSEEEAIQISFDTWANLPGIDLQFVKDPSKTINSTGYDKENSILWVESNWTGQSFQPPSAALAVTISTYKTSSKEIVDSDIHFNGEYFEWGVIDTNEEEVGNVVDIQNIATHEIGHFIGLDHSSEDFFETDSRLYLATMFFASGPGEIFRRKLDNDDIDAMNNLYPDVDHGMPQVDAIIPDSIDISRVSNATIQITGDDFVPFTAVMLATNSDRGDVPGKVLSIGDNEIHISFDLFGLPSGEYDVVVSNAFDRTKRVGDGLTLVGGFNDPTGSNDGFSSASDGGGCNISPARSGGEWVTSGLLVLFLPLLLIGWARLQLSESRTFNASGRTRRRSAR